MSPSSEPTEAELTRALAAYPALTNPRARRLSGGLINDTYAVDEDGGGAFILQRVNPIFDPVIHDSIDAVTRHIADRGLVTPRLVETREGRSWVELPGGVWRLMTRMAGSTFDRVQAPSQARAAGALAGRFHSALVDLEHSFRGARLGVHDTVAHLAALDRALRERSDHRLYAPVSALAADIRRAFADDMPTTQDVPRRVCHGDLKFSNIVFAGDEPPARDRAVCLIDLDTLAPMPLHHELGDAWRSWCNTGGEDREEARFDMTIFTASLEGYLGALEFSLRASERRALVASVEWISLELAARFAADALRESYFGWDREGFASAGEHNLVRARGQWALYQSARGTRRQREALLL